MKYEMIYKYYRVFTEKFLLYVAKAPVNKSYNYKTCQQVSFFHVILDTEDKTVLEISKI